MHEPLPAEAALHCCFTRGELKQGQHTRRQLHRRPGVPTPQREGALSPAVTPFPEDGAALIDSGEDTLTGEELASLMEQRCADLGLLVERGESVVMEEVGAPRREPVVSLDPLHLREGGVGGVEVEQSAEDDGVDVDVLHPLLAQDGHEVESYGSESEGRSQLVGLDH